MLVKSKDLVEDTVKMIADYQSGKIKPLKTGIESLDTWLLGGFTPGTVLLIEALSFHGKTTYLTSILDGLGENNKEEDIIFLTATWEIEQFKIIATHLAKSSNKSVKEILYNKPTEEDKAIYTESLKKFRADNLYVEPSPVSAEEFTRDVRELMAKHKGSRIVVSIDNLENVLLSNTSSQKLAMDEVIRAINVLKKEGNIMFIILNQANRNILARTDPKEHFPIFSSDSYQTSAPSKLADVSVFIHMPFRLGIKDYGLFPKERYRYIDKKFIREGAGKNNKFVAIADDGSKYGYVHCLKYRNMQETEDTQDVFPFVVYEKEEK